jgi:hypothetical protein
MGVNALAEHSVGFMKSPGPDGIKTNRISFASCWELAPFFLIACAIPLIILRIPVAYHSEMRSFIVTARGYDDYFHLIKAWVLYAATAMLFAAFLVKKAASLPRMFVFFIPYISLILLSASFSKTAVTSVFGFADHYEGALAQICYALILIFSYCFPSDEDRILTVVKFVLWGATGAALIGLLQLAGNPLIGSLIPGETLQFASLQAKADVSGITSTIGNSNYTGTYAVILIPLSVMVVIREKSIFRKAFALVAYFGSAVFLLFGSLSRAGYVSFMLVCPLMAVLLWKTLKKQLLWAMMALAYAGCVFVAMNIGMGGMLLKEVKGLNPFIPETAGADKLVFRDIRLDANTAVIETNRYVIRVQNSENGFLLQDGEGNLIPSVYDETSQSLMLTGQPYENIHAWEQEKESVRWILLMMEGKDMEFVHTGETMKVVGFNSVLTDIAPVRAFAGIKNEAFASGRGYIWSRSMPLLKEAVLWGFGPDTFPYVFPQNDIVGKLNYGSIWVIISKPHNWYLQVALGSGVLSLLCLLLFFGWHAVKTIRVHARKDQGERTLMAFTFLLCLVGFLAAGVFNDSVVSVSPIVWMLCGFGVRLSQSAEGKVPE